MSAFTQQSHDIEQARRWTPAQRLAVIDVVQGTMAGGEDGMWGYTDVPPEGGTVTLRTPSGQEWAIDEAGIAHDRSAS